MTQTQALTKIWQTKVHLHQKYHQPQLVKRVLLSQTIPAEAQTEIWKYKFRLHQKGYRL